MKEQPQVSQQALESGRPTIVFLLLAPISETLFVLLPLIVITIVFLSSGEKGRDIFSSPEWSFGAAVLYGQSITKLIAGTLRARAKNWEVVMLFSALVIVFGLVPSLTVLSLMLTGKDQSIGMIVSQIVLFIAGVGVFLFFGLIGHYGLFHAIRTQSKVE